MAKIILIESTGLVRIKFEKTLRKYGFDDVEVFSGEEIFTSLGKNSIKKATIIFIDSDNRDNDPKKLLDTIRTDYKSNAYSVIITSKGSASYVKELLSYGSNDILAKPYSEIKLMEKVFNAGKAPSMLSISNHIQENIEDKGRYMPLWNEDLELGLESIDQEHKGLIEHYERLYQKMKKGEGHDYCIELLNYLKNYVNTHFANEEAFLDKINYTDSDNHKDIHNAFKTDLLMIANEFELHEIDNLKLIKFNLFIKNWCMYHILVEDRNYIEFYHKNQ
jgi:hemerythrin-like metal-binding protein